MSRFVRVVALVPVDGADPQAAAEALRRRAAGLPSPVAHTVVVTGAGVLVTLTTRYRRVPGGHRRSVRLLQRWLRRVTPR